MKIWVDADACPVVIKEILYKAAERTKTQLILVANRYMKIPKSTYIEFLQVQSGLDVADNRIVEKMAPKDLVITSDIPLASKVVEKGGFGLNPRGEIYTAENIGERLSTRDFLDTLRSSGIETGGPASLTKRDRQSFANSLDKILTQNDFSS
ncbi:YaiI/YqxD family protein [Desulfogranum japonicum]|uniref:YaiI/YqxD family protein n=1 Tax=Desulfogranum japonicum TaxID=231447 RepID=UPI000413AC49|nr:YaiI/YqxD family protein [Desulfogranum japonicum]